MVQPMKLEPMILPDLVGAQSKVLSLASSHFFRLSPSVDATSRSQVVTASAKAEPRPSSSLVLVKGRNLPRPEAVTYSTLQSSPCALTGSTVAPTIRSAAPAAAPPSTRATAIMPTLPTLWPH